MRIDVTPSAEATIQRVGAAGRSDLVVVLGTGCCDSTAPYLYDHCVVEPDAVQVGEASGVPIFAHAWLAKLYGDDELVLDVDEDVITDSFSLESDLDCRLTLRTAAS